MKRRILSLVAAFAIAASALAPAAAEARDRHGGYYDRHRHDYYNHRRHHRDDDAIVASVVGLALGLTLGALASQPRPEPRASCYDSYQRCAPPPPRYQGYDDRLVYYDDGAYYEDPRAAYERDYGRAPEPRCERQERVWDRVTQRYVIMDAC